MEKNKAKRIEYIDTAKGLAILLVVIGHVLIYDCYNFDAAANDNSLNHWLYSFHMPLFMFLSGLLAPMAEHWCDIKRDIIKRFRSLIIPFFVFGTIYSLYIGHGVEWLMHNAKYGYWYLLALFCFYIANYITNNILSRLKPCRIGGGISLVVVLWYCSVVANGHIPDVIRDVAGTTWLTTLFPYFFAGALVKRYNLYERIFSSDWLFIIGCIICWGVYLLPLEGANVLSFALGYIVKFSSILIAVYVCRIATLQKWPTLNLFIHIGKASLYIYMFHYFAVQMMMMEWLKPWLIRHQNVIITLAIVALPTAFAIVFSLVVKKVMESNEVIQRCIFNKY